MSIIRIFSIYVFNNFSRLCEILEAHEGCLRKLKINSRLAFQAAECRGKDASGTRACFTAVSFLLTFYRPLTRFLRHAKPRYDEQLLLFSLLPSFFFFLHRRCARSASGECRFVGAEVQTRTSELMHERTRA